MRSKKPRAHSIAKIFKPRETGETPKEAGDFSDKLVLRNELPLTRGGRGLQNLLNTQPMMSIRNVVDFRLFIARRMDNKV
jgi:hypothetical protein